MSELTLLVLRLAFLLVLGGFVFAVVYALKSDLFGAPVRKIKGSEQPVAASNRQTDPGDAFAAALATPPVALATQAAMPTSMPTSLSTPSDATDIIATPSAYSSGPAAPAGPAQRIVITNGPKAGVEFSLGVEPLTIGRSSDSGLVIRDEYTSTHHARIALRGSEWFLHDLGSTNGTFLNSKRVNSPVAIALNTPITIGKTTFELRP